MNKIISGKIYKVHGGDIKKKLYTHEREFYCNDFHNHFYPNCTITANRSFEKCGVPEAFRVMYVRVYRKGFKKVSEELFTKRPLQVKRFKKGLAFTSGVTLFYGDTVYDNVTFKASKATPSNAEYIRHCQMLYNYGHLESYVDSINEIFEVSKLSEYEIKDITEKKHKVKKAHKPFKKKAAKKLSKRR